MHPQTSFSTRSFLNCFCDITSQSCIRLFDCLHHKLSTQSENTQKHLGQLCKFCRRSCLRLEDLHPRHIQQSVFLTSSPLPRTVQVVGELPASCGIRQGTGLVLTLLQLASDWPPQRCLVTKEPGHPPALGFSTDTHSAMPPIIRVREPIRQNPCCVESYQVSLSPASSHCSCPRLNSL